MIVQDFAQIYMPNFSFAKRLNIYSSNPPLFFLQLPMFLKMKHWIIDVLHFNKNLLSQLKKVVDVVMLKKACPTPRSILVDDSNTISAADIDIFDKSSDYCC